MSDPIIETVEVSTELNVAVVEVTEGVVPVKGDKGDPGPVGPKGDKGDPGERGADGAPGPQGDAGEPGAPGRDGVDGAQGEPGAAGADGAAGPKGDKGDKGDPGDAGAQGVPGKAGPKGDAGDTGPAGADGAQGPKGDTGDTGPVGPAGPKGDTGDQGPQGIQGIQGEKGDKGDTGPQGPAGTSGTTSIPGSTNSILYKASASAMGGNSNMLRTADNGFQLNGNVIKPMSEASFPFFQVTDQYTLPGNRTLGHHEGFTSMREWQASDGLNTYAKAMPIITAGTATAQAISNAQWLAEPALNYVTASATGSQAAWIGTAPVVSSTSTGGFLVTMRMSIKGIATGKRWFVGLVVNPVVPGNVNISTLTNFIGIGADAGDSQVYVMTRGASGSASRSQQNIAATLNGENLTVVFSSFPGMGEVKCGFQFGGYGWGGSFNFNGLLYPAAWVSTGTTSTPITLSMNRVYVEYLTIG